MAPDFLVGAGGGGGRRSSPRLCGWVGGGYWRGSYGGGGGFGFLAYFFLAYFVSAEVAAFIVCGLHFGHGGVGLGVIVVGVPEKKADSAFLFGHFDLDFNILGRVSPGAPGEGLQPGTNYDAAIFGDEFETVHGLADEMLGCVAGVGDAIHAKEVRGIDHGREHIAVLGHGDDVLTGVRQIDGTLPGHDSEDVEREQDPGGMDLSVGPVEEIGDDFGTRLVRMLGLVIEGSIFLVAFGGKADVVKLNFVDSGLGDEFRQGDVVILDFGVRGVGPDELAVFTPGLIGAAGLYREFGMSGDEVLIAEEGDAGDGVHVFGMQEVNKLRQIGNIVALSGGEGVVEGDVDDAVAIFDIEDDGVATDFLPMADDAQSVIAAGHDSGEINRAYFKISCNWHRFLYNGGFENSGDNDLLSGFEESSLEILIGVTDGLGEFGRGEEFCALQIFAGDGGDAVSALGEVNAGSRRRDDGDERRGSSFFGGSGIHLKQLLGMGILHGGCGWRQEKAGQGHAEEESGSSLYCDCGVQKIG